ncbi:DUF4349 domain-containing protein [Halobium salinum]|uniref:DUF4349 domain-containing protein n=1 Tax=Halobium salinum TaxID=1364940 RepID=A0ABD5P7H6_9EURY|nr:DUF4349 domain-containing protein [Halobium salinum]
MSREPRCGGTDERSDGPGPDGRRLLRAVAVVALAALVVLAGCSGAGNDAAGGGGSGSVDTGAESGAAGGAADGAASEATASAGDSAAERSGSATASASGFAEGRVQIRLGTVDLRVEDYDAARRNVTAATARYGGFVSDSSEQVHERGNDSWTTGTLVVRVPNENFSAAMEETKAQGRVDSANTETKDVTEEVVDTEARLTNLRTQRDRLRELYESANDTESVLQVQERLSEVQSEIERLEGRLRTLENRVAYSTITVTLREEPPEREIQPRPQWYDTPVVAAFLQSVDGVATTLRAAVVAAAYLAPYALAFGVPVVGVAVLARRRLR